MSNYTNTRTCTHIQFTNRNFFWSLAHNKAEKWKRSHRYHISPQKKQLALKFVSEKKILVEQVYTAVLRLGFFQQTGFLVFWSVLILTIQLLYGSKCLGFISSPKKHSPHEPSPNDIYKKKRWREYYDFNLEKALKSLASSSR